jgi:putative transposase
VQEHRGRFGVEPICRTLGVSASAFYRRASGVQSARAVEDERLLELIRATHERNYFAYGYRRMWKALLRAGESVPRCRVQRLMRQHRIVGAKRRGRPWRTTRPDPLAHRRADLVQRDFTASRPDELWVADLSYLRCWDGLVFFAFVVDAFSRKVVGWQLAAHMRADLVLDALRMALHQRKPGAQVELVHHSDRGSQPALNRSSQQCVGGVTVGMVAEPRRCGWAVVTRLSSRRPARRAGRSGDSSVRACRTPVGCQRLGVRAQRPAGRTGRAAFRQRGSGTRSAFRRAFASRAFSGAGC